jgi:CopG-like RHH_1 or ribbon-helix-helix domain, RHH_5
MSYATNEKGSVRVVATLPPGIYELLRITAEAEGRQPGNLAGYVIEAWLREHAHAAPLAETVFPKQVVES